MGTSTTAGSETAAEHLHETGSYDHIGYSGGEDQNSRNGRSQGDTAPTEVTPKRVMNDTTFTGVYGKVLADQYGINISIARDYLSNGSLDQSISAGGLTETAKSFVNASFSALVKGSSYSTTLAKGFVDEVENQLARLGQDEFHGEKWGQSGLLLAAACMIADTLAPPDRS